MTAATPVKRVCPLCEVEAPRDRSWIQNRICDACCLLVKVMAS